MEYALRDAAVLIAARSTARVFARLCGHGLCFSDFARVADSSSNHRSNLVGVRAPLDFTNCDIDSRCLTGRDLRPGGYDEAVTPRTPCAYRAGRRLDKSFAVRCGIDTPEELTIHARGILPYVLCRWPEGLTRGGVV